ncbi:MAG: hypothetical protein ACJAQ6_001881, partial [Arenicella sp.]
MITLIIWAVAIALYGLFYSWYIGFRQKVTTEEVALMITRYQNDSAIAPEQAASL